MEHLAIMKRSLKLLPKIVSGEKMIESRWYATRRQPYGCIDAGDRVYFKNSGEPVSVMADVKRVLVYDGLDERKIGGILKRYGKEIFGRGFDYGSYDGSWFDGKNYCILVFLENVTETEPFDIDKTGYGISNAWISVKNIDMLRKG